MIKTILIFFTCISFLTLKGQNPIGLPEIVSYSNQDYKAGVQNWDIQQDKKGVLYFANYEGLLTFNGRSWNLLPLPNNTVVRSVEISSDGKIFVGAQDEIGYFFPEENGLLKYHSLKNLIPVKERQFADVWNIEAVGNDIFFRGRDKLFQLTGGKINVFKSASGWVYLARVNDRLYAQERGKGLMIFNKGKWDLLCNDALFKEETVSSILDYDDTALLVTTLKKGLFLLRGSVLTKKETSADNNFYTDRIYCAKKVNSDWFALGTTSGDCYIIDHSGNTVQKFSFPGGSVRMILIDANANLWFSLDDGIAFIPLNNAAKNIYPNSGKQLSVYAIKVFDNKLYIGTSNGLFASSLNPADGDLSYSKGAFKELSKGQIWELSEINDHLLVGHEDGEFVLKDDNALEKIASPAGTWLYEALDFLKPSKELIAGTYDGMHYIQYRNNKFIDKGHIAGLTEPLRFLKIDSDQSIWASHPYRGIYKIRLSSDKKKILSYRLYTEKDGLPSDLNNYIFRIKGKIITATEKGIYEYNSSNDRMEPSDFLRNIFGQKNLEYLIDDKYGNIWFVADKRVGVVDFHKPSANKAYSIIYFPELSSRMISRFEKIYPYNNENIFIACDKGVFHLNYVKYFRNLNTVNVILTNVRSFGIKDSVLYGGYLINNDKIKSLKKIKLSHSQNSLHFEYASTAFVQQKNIEFSYKLTGFDHEWSVWTAKNEKDYTNLPPGTFTFEVRSRNNLHNESEPVVFTFTIIPAWYQTVYTYLFCLLLVIGIVYLLIKWQKEKHKKAQEHLKYIHQLELENSEKQIIDLKNEKLEAEVSFKNKELTTTTMHLIQRGKLLKRIKDEWIELVKSEKSLEDNIQFRRILRLLNVAERNDVDWETFSIHFDQVHSNFLSTLKAIFPDLSRNDLKMCAYVKMNLSSKEIAQLMNLTIRAVEVSRYRLRKKLPISSDVNLYDYLIKVTTGDYVAPVESKPSAREKEEAI